jgi:hypothetical protein
MGNLPYSTDTGGDWWSDMFTNDTMTQYLDGDNNQRSYEGAEVSPADAIGYGRSFAGLSGLSSVPGVGFGIDTAQGMAQGKSLGQAAATAGVKQGVAALSAFGPIGQAAQLGIGIATSQNPAKTATKAVATALGSLAGPFGAALGGLLGDLAYASYEDGMIGDAMDSRDDEGMRDRAENSGYSRGQTADAADVDSRADDSGFGIGAEDSESGYGISPGLSDLDSALGRIGRAAFGGYDDSGYGGGGDSNDSGGGMGNGTTDPSGSVGL